jgi:hypothetical protein
MSNNWLNNIKHVAPGEPVQAGVVGRPDRALVDRTNYLKDRLDAAELGRAIVDSDATIAPDVLPGQPVYWSVQAQRYERALAAVESDPVTQQLVVQASSDCLGICVKKKGETLGDIVLRGLVQLPELTNAVTGSITAGRYYLSTVEPGKLVKQRPPVAVSVCYVQGPKDNCSDAPWVVVMPQVRDFLEDHIHYRFDLVCRPAGVHDPDAAALAGTHTITDPDAALEGWLPADHVVFQGRAPAGAKFGYNFSQHVALDRVWPPQPVQAVAVLWDKGIDRVGATEIPLGPNGLCIADINGIWWLSDCYGDVPWPATLSTVPTSVSEAQSLEAVCPRDDDAMRVSVVYLRAVYGNDRSVVTSLQPAENSPITVLNCDGLPGRTGDLELGLNLQFLVDPAEAIGAQAFKEITPEFKFKRGWVTEGLRGGGGPITVTGTRTRALTEAEKTALGLPSNDTSTIKQGIVTIGYNDQFVDREISPQIIRLSDAVERLYKDIPYLGFPEAQNALVRVRMNVPAANLGETMTMKMRVQLFGRINAVLPALTMTYRIIPRSAQAVATVNAGATLPDTDTALTFTVPGTSLNADKAIELESATFSVQEGDTVLVTLSRDGAEDSYAGEIGILRTTGILNVI